MERTNEQPRRNDSLQSGAGDTAIGQDPRDFGAGGQTIQRPVESNKDDRPDRDPERDESLPPDQHPSRSKR